MTALERKENSEQLLSKFNIVRTDDLPPIEEEHAVTLRTPEEVAERILILTYLNCVANDPSLQQEVMIFLIREKLWDKATEGERALFHRTPLTEKDLSVILWRAESIWALLWVINKVERLDLPDTEVNLHEIFARLPGFLQSTRYYINTATMRTTGEILDQLDFIFRLNWALRQTPQKGSRASTFNPGVVYERYFSLSWVTQTVKEWET